MSYKIKLGTFSKLENSTAQPTTTSWAEYDVTLKDGCDLLDPEVKLNISEATVSNYNYATMFGKYFFIADKYMLRENLCVLQLRHDPMASYKSQIGSTTLYVLRSAAASNGNIKDNFYPMLSAPDFNYQSISNLFPDYVDGYYIINALGTTNNASTLYQMDFATFRKVLNSLFSQAANASSIGSDFAQAVVNSMFNPIDYINWAAWTPIPFNGTAASSMYLGRWSYTPGSGDDLEVITDTMLQVTGQLTIPKHPQESRGNYLNFYPYTEYILNLQPFGMIPVDTKRVSHIAILDYYVKIDAQSGIATLELVDGNTGSVVENVSCKYLVDIPIGSAAQSPGLISSLISGGAALLTGNIAGGIAAGTSAIGSATEFLSPQARSIGAQGSIAAFQCYQGFLAIFHRIADEDKVENGRPLCERRQISTLSGYNQVSDGYVTIPGTITEQQEIKSILESGFFYE